MSTYKYTPILQSKLDKSVDLDLIALTYKIMSPARLLGNFSTQNSLFRTFRFLTAALKTFFFVHLLNANYLYSSGLTWGASMLPTLEVVQDRVICDHWYRRGRGIEVGDVIQFHSVYEPGGKVIKRVIGLEGDYVLMDTPNSEMNTMIQVPQGHCWVVGDNLAYSKDSRHLGPVPMALITGKIVSKILPWKERKFVENNLNLVKPISQE